MNLDVSQSLRQLVTTDLIKDADTVSANRIKTWIIGQAITIQKVFAYLFKLVVEYKDFIIKIEDLILKRQENLIMKRLRSGLRGFEYVEEYNLVEDKMKRILCVTKELLSRVDYHARFNKHEALVLLQQLSVRNIRGAVTTMRDTEHRWRLMSVTGINIHLPTRKIPWLSMTRR